MKKLTSPQSKLKNLRKKNRQSSDLNPMALQNPDTDVFLPTERTKRLRLPSTKYSHREIAGKFTHNLLSVALPLAVYVLVAIFHLSWLALILILLSKWQIFVVKPRFWWANLKFSAVDLIFKLSVLLLMVQSQEKIDLLINKSSLPLHLLQATLVTLYLFWNTYLRKLSSSKGMLFQSLASQGIGLISVAWLAGFSVNTLPIPIIIGLTWIITYASAQHSMYAFEETAIPQLAGFWALFATSLSFLQYIWGQNFLFFSSLIYIPLMPFVVSAFSYLAATTHSYIEDTQNDEDISKVKLSQHKELLTKQAAAACIISLFLAVLIAAR